MLLFTVKIIPPPCAQGTRLGVRLKRLMSDITLQKYKKEVSVQNKFKFILEKEGKSSCSGFPNNHFCDL